MKTKSAFSGIQIKRPAMLTGVLCLLVTATAPATEAGERPCANDAAKLCKGVQPGEGRIVNCLREHKDELSPACKENIAKAKEWARNTTQACEGDAQKLCKGIQPGEGRILQCLKQHEGELSKACKEQLNRPKGQQK